jgi:hypothetical protein
MHSTPFGSQKAIRELARRDRRIAKATRLSMRRAERKAMTGQPYRPQPERDAQTDEVVK